MLRILGLGAVLALIVAAWLLLGESEEPSAGEQDVASLGSSPDGTDSQGKVTKGANAAGGTLPAPVRMRSDNPDKAVAPSASGDSLADAFAAEDVDKELSAKRSALIRKVIDEVLIDKEGGAHLSDLECRSLHCLIKISGEDQKSVTSLVDSLQDERGFFGKAESLMMSRDGDEIHMYLRFAE